MRRLAWFIPLLATAPSAAEPESPPRVFTGHTRPVHAVMFCPSGKTALSGGDDHTVRGWDVETGRELWNVKGYTGFGPGVMPFSRDGRFFLSRRCNLKICEAATGREVLFFSGHEEEVECAAFSPDGKRVISGDREGAIKLWDAETGRELHALGEGGGGEVVCAAFSPDGTRAVSGDGKSGIRLWDVDSGRGLWAFSPGVPVWCVAFSPDSKRLSWGSQERAGILDAETGREILAFKGQKGGVRQAVFSPDGTRVLSIDDRGDVKLWNAETGQENWNLDDKHWISRAVFSPDGAKVLSASDDGVKLRDAGTGRVLWAFDDKTGSAHVAFSPDGGRALITGDDIPMKIRDVETGRELRTFSGQKGDWAGVAFTPDGKRILSVRQDNHAVICDAETGHPIHEADVPGCFWAAGLLSPDGARLLVGSHEVELRETRTGRVMHTLRGHAGEIACAAFSPDGKRALTGSLDHTFRLGGGWTRAIKDRSLKLWDVETGGELRTFTGLEAPVTAVALSSDGKRALLGDDEGAIELRDMETGREIRSFTGHPRRVGSLAFSPDETLALSIQWQYGTGHPVRLWNVETGGGPRTLTETGRRPIGNAAFTPDGKFVLCGSLNDERIFLWNVNGNGNLEFNYSNSKKVSCIAVSPDGGALLIGGNDDGTIVWGDLRPLIARVTPPCVSFFFPENQLTTAKTRVRCENMARDICTQYGCEWRKISRDDAAAMKSLNIAGDRPVIVIFQNGTEIERIQGRGQQYFCSDLDDLEMELAWHLQGEGWMPYNCIERPREGKPAPEIEGEDVDGKSFRLSDYRGKVVVLDFWGDW